MMIDIDGIYLLFTFLDTFCESIVYEVLEQFDFVLSVVVSLLGKFYQISHRFYVVLFVPAND